MSRSTKLTLDILLGAVVPILILSYLTDPLGAVPAYLLSALIPVGWVAVDLLFITRRLNVITGFLGLNAVARGLLAFWFVDGALYAFKDSVGAILAVLVFGGSLFVGRPVVRAFAEQSLDPRTPEQESALGRLFSERSVVRALFWSTAVLAVVFAVTGVANFVLNLWIVTAPFGADAFNVQVAQVNAITRIALAIPEFIAWGIALYLIFHAIHTQLPTATKDQNFWDLVAEREAENEARSDPPNRNPIRAEGSNE